MYSNYNYSKEEAYCSWPVIIIALYLFFPVGIYLLFKKASLHRRNIFTIGQKTFSTAISLMIFGFLFFIPKIIVWMNEVGINELSNQADWESIINSKVYERILNYATFFFALGIIVMIISIYQKQKASRYQKYISIVINKEIEDLDNIANKMKCSKTKVIKDLNYLKKKRFFEEYEIDVEENRIYNVPKEKRRREEKQKNKRIVKCPNCHANNLLEEKYGKCEYCNSYIG